jgi:hypothetical protein
MPWFRLSFVVPFSAMARLVADWQCPNDLLFATIKMGCHRVDRRSVCYACSTTGQLASELASEFVVRMTAV